MRRLPGAHRLAWAVVAAASVWLRGGIPIHAIGDANRDDLLFLRIARSIGTGNWLGPADGSVLAKGMFYPLFVLLTFAAGIPLKLAEQAVWLLAAAVPALLLARRDRFWVATVLFAVLAFSPTLLTVDLSRVIREGLYVSLSLAVVALLVLVAFAAPAESGRGRAGWAVARGLALGLVAGAFWLTREEGIWIVPACLAVLGVAVLGRTAPLLPTLLSLGVAVLAFGGTVGADMAMNQRFYGVPYTVEVNATPFRRAYGALSRIKPAQWERYVVFPRDARELAYRVSPAARELQPGLEGKLGDNWRAVTCAAEGTPGCTEVKASWFQWELRDAVAGAGHYGSLTDAAAFYTRLADEIDAACDRGEIPCLPPRATLLPPFRPEYVTDALRRATTLLPELVRLGDVGAQPSTGPLRNQDAFEDAVGLVYRVSAQLLAVHGSVRTPAGPPLLAVRTVPGAETRTDIALSPGGPGGDATARDFDLTTTCVSEGCDLLVWAGTEPPVSVPLAALMEPGTVERPGVTISVEFTSHPLFRRGQDLRVAAVLRVARPLGRAYNLVMPVLAAAGLLGTAAAGLLRFREAVRSPLFALAAASVAAIATRVALVAFLDVTSIRSHGILYLSPATPFVIVLGVTGSVLLARLAMRRPLLPRTAALRMAPRNPGVA